MYYQRNQRTSVHILKACASPLSSLSEPLRFGNKDGSGNLNSENVLKDALEFALMFNELPLF